MANELLEKKYLKSRIIDSKKNDCTEKSFVRVYKSSQTDYFYVPYLICNNETINTSTNTYEGISINFSNSKDVRNAIVSYNIKSSNVNNNYIKGFSYTIYDLTDGSTNEIYKSGEISGKREKIIDGTINISQFLDITTKTIVRISITAVDSDNKITIGSKDGNFVDSEGPTCGNIVNSPKIADLDVWVGKYNKRNSRTVTVSCIDSKNGSGCVRKSFSKTWPNDEKDSFGKKIYKFGAETSTITISDNAGEKTICPVVVNVDVLSPSISLSAKVNDGTTNEKEVYKLSDIGGYKDNGDKYVENPFTKVIEANDYDQSVLPKRNDNNIWINSTYSSGITYTIKVDDNFYLKSWEWKTNKKISYLVQLIKK